MQPLYEYVCHIKGHRNSNGELAEWVIKSHETGKILSSHKSEKKAKEHLQQMHIFKESVDGVSYPKMYHICGYMTGLDNDDIRDILTNGLRINDNGESNCIWFSMNKPFGNGGYDALRPLIVSLDCSPENLRKYHIDEFDVRNNADVVMAHESISPEDINIEQLMWGEVHRPSNNTVRHIIDPSFYGNFERWLRFDKGLTFVVYEDLYNMWARNQIAKMGLNPDLNRLKEIMGDRVTIMNFLTPSEPTGYKLLGETTNGNTMDKRFNIFMENVAKLGLSKNQFEAVGNITKVCLEGSFGQTQKPENDDIGIVYVSRYGHSALDKLPKMRYADFLKQHDKMASYGDVGPIKKYRMPLIDTEENLAQFVNYDSIPEDTNGNAWGFAYGRKSGFEYISEKYIWLPSDAFDASVPLEKEGSDVGCIGEMRSNSRENILGIRRDQTYDDFMIMYKKACALAAREPNEYKVSKLTRYSTPPFNPLSVKIHHMSFDSIKPDENGNILGFEEYHRPGHPFQVVTKILWLPANTEDPEDKTPSDEDIYSALYPDEAPTYGGRVRTSEEEYDPDNPGDPSEDDYYTEHENEWDPDNRDDDEIEF